MIGGLLTGLLVLAAFELMIRPAFAVSAGDVIVADRTISKTTTIDPFN